MSSHQLPNLFPLIVHRCRALENIRQFPTFDSVSLLSIVFSSRRLVRNRDSLIIIIIIIR
ncbi:unnamed protein product [Periconia digitata]|uniref:Uncharacterized protein n=1 Tax=Periconia digitata TaxID=1303443 RepID=A0A9W4XQA8_9PLEO|nr:unnamed protein product [Periconia digitata]